MINAPRRKMEREHIDWEASVKGNQEMNKNMKTIKDLPRGWANLQKQLKEVRDESFKQGIWKEQERILGLIDELEVFGIEDGNAILKEELKARIIG